MIQKVAGSNSGLVQLATGKKSLRQPSSKWVSFFQQGKANAAKGGKWGPFFICFALMQWAFNPHDPAATRLWKTFTFLNLLSVCHKFEHRVSNSSGYNI